MTALVVSNISYYWYQCTLLCKHQSFIIFSDQLPVSTKFDMHSDPGVVRNYGRLLLEMASAVPDGIVCFFVSYSYMDGIVNSWHEMGILQVISFTCILFSHINPTIQIKYRYGNEEWVCSAERSWARKKE